jgi:4-hydroxy 2-oxovalerate aldolase
METLDCTLRDGGYYTDWDFDKDLVDSYIENTNNLPLDFLEIGYRSPPLKGYQGEYFYLPDYVVDVFVEKSNKQLAILLNEKDITATDVGSLLNSIIGKVTLIRIAVAPENIRRALGLVQEIKKLGFLVALNVMYMSKWHEIDGFYDNLRRFDQKIDYFYMVDSYGGVFSNDVESIFRQVVMELPNVRIGFHGHNNLELALSNTLKAIELGIDIVDSTILGMGRGSGNLKTELLLVVLKTRGHLDVDLAPLSNIVLVFDKLLQKYNWGATLPYMIAGAISIPQKNVMEWVTIRDYPINSIIQKMKNISAGLDDNEQFETFRSLLDYSQVLLVGGGESSVKHKRAIAEYCETNPDTAIVHSSSKYIELYKDYSNDQYLVLLGNEGGRLEPKLAYINQDLKFVLPPYPRFMGTYVPQAIKSNCYEIGVLTDNLELTRTSLALEFIKSLGVSRVYLTGYDGYNSADISLKELALFNENEAIFTAYSKSFTIESLTPTAYSIDVNSIYKNI